MTTVSSDLIGSPDIVIVGAGQAGGWVARTLVERQYPGRITLIGTESHAPYERPSLSKSVLAGIEDYPPYVLPDEHLAGSNISFFSGTTVKLIDRASSSVICADGRTIPYGRLVLAQGGRPRIPPIAGLDLPGVHFLRTLDDCRALSAHLSDAKRLTVIGGGWIGLEVAATARQQGLDVVLIEAGDRLCGRSVPANISEYLLHKHLAEGVEVHLGAAVEAIEQTDQQQLAVRLHSGKLISDLVVVGAGQIPNVELAVEAGLSVDNGIVVDEYGQTSDPRIFAVGDVSNHPNLWAQTRLRLESWANAQNQAVTLGRTLAGEPSTYDEIPWFWSNQYDMNLQVVGIPDANATSIVRGSIEDGQFTVFQIKGERLVAAVGVNSPREVKLAKRWMRSGKHPEPRHLQDSAVRLDRL